MSSLVSASRYSLATLRQERDLRLAGSEAVGRVELAAAVADYALYRTFVLSQAEARLIEQVPLGEARYKAIVDTFTGVAAASIARIGS